MNTHETCSRCWGRGYKPEARKPSRRNPNALGFYARSCPKCGGTGVTEPKPPKAKPTR